LPELKQLCRLPGKPKTPLIGSEAYKASGHPNAVKKAESGAYRQIWTDCDN
jgi:hypothetical protein